MLYHMLMTFTFIKQQDGSPAPFFQTNVNTLWPQSLHYRIDVN